MVHTAISVFMKSEMIQRRMDDQRDEEGGMNTMIYWNSMKCISTWCSFFQVFSEERVEYVNGAY